MSAQELPKVLQARETAIGSRFVRLLMLAYSNWHNEMAAGILPASHSVGGDPPLTNVTGLTMTSPKSYLAIFVICGSVSPWSKPAGAEIPAGKDVPTIRNYRAAELKFLSRTIIDPYVKRHAEEEGATDDGCKAFLAGWVELAQFGLSNRDSSALAAKGQQLAEAGSDDAMFHYCYGRLLRSRNEHDRAVKHLQKAFDTLVSQGYDVSYRCWASNHLSQSLAQVQRFVDAEAACAGEADLLVETIASPTYGPGDQRLLYEHVKWYFDNWPIERVEELLAKLESTDGMSEWLRHVLQAKLESRQGWRARGGGWASEVSEEGWQKFGEHLGRAYTHLKQAWDLDNSSPEPAVELIALAMAGHTPTGETPRFWFDRAVSAQFDHELAYHNLRWSLLPRWGGSHEQLLAFGRECLKTERFDTYVPYRYFEIVSLIASDIGSSYDVYKDESVFREIVAMADGYLAQPATDWNHGWYKSLKVAAAVRGEQWGDAKRFLLDLEVNPDPDAFARFALKPDDAIGETHARTGEFASPVKAAEELLAAEDFEGAKSQYQSLLEKSADRDSLSRYLRRQIAWVEMQQKLAAGEWVNLLPDATFAEWRVRDGNWTIDEAGQLVGQAGTSGLLLTFERNLGTRFEIRGQSKFVESPSGNFNIEICFGPESGFLRSSFRFSRSENFAAIMDHDKPQARLDCPVPDFNSFLVQRWDNTLTAYLNDQLVAVNEPIEAYGRPENEVFGIGGDDSYNGPTIAFEQLDVRLLKTPPENTSQAQDTDSD